MMARKHARMAWLGVLLTLATTACSSRDAYRGKLASCGESQKSVLVASAGSPFKDALVKRLIERYCDRASFVVIDLRQLTNSDISQFEAVLVLEARKGWMMFNGRVRWFVRKVREPEKVILVLTSANHDFKWKRNGVDAITCASSASFLDPTLERISQQLDVLLAPEGSVSPD
jgi:hypothetical protein